MKIKALMITALLAGSLYTSGTYANDNEKKQNQLEQKRLIAKNYDNLKLKAKKNKVTVIAKLIDSEDIGTASGPSKKFLRTIEKLEKKGLKANKKIKRQRIATFEVNEKELNNLLDSGLVELVEEDTVHPPTLIQSVNQISADAVHNIGITGNGQSIAVLDTGFDIDHPFLENRIIEQACFSTTNSQATSLCPSGQQVEISGNAAASCDPNIFAGCHHGTYVAGIAAGSNSSSNGVAPGANIVAIQVFSGFPEDNANCNARPCVLSYRSDQIAALDWLLGEATTNVAAINISLGSGNNSSYCDSDSIQYTSSINQLRANGVLTVIASGNSAHPNAVAFPGCIEAAITVGSTEKNNDQISEWFSNGGALVDVVAPGSNITSSSLNGLYISSSGTSGSAPHVAGAIALLRAKDPGLTANEIEAILEDTGVAVIDARTGLTFPRIDVAQAIIEVAPSLAPSAPSVTASLPLGSDDVTISWTEPTGATEYTREVSIDGGPWINSKTYYYPQNSVEFPNQQARSYKYRMNACNELGCSVWSESNTVTVIPPPQAPSSVTAAVTDGDNDGDEDDIRITWSFMTGSTHYKREVSTDDGVSWRNEHTYTTTSTTFFNQIPRDYLYRVKACNNSGCSGWTISNSVTIPEPPPPIPVAPSPVSASANGGDDMVITWSLVTGATYYNREVSTSDNLTWRNEKTYAHPQNTVTFPNQQPRSYQYRMRACNTSGCSNWTYSNFETVN